MKILQYLKLHYKQTRESTYEFKSIDELCDEIGYQEVIDIITDFDNQQLETRVYLVDTTLDDYDDLPTFRNDCTDDEFIEYAEREGRIYSLETFTNKFNGRESIAINFNADMIRFIQVPVSL